MDYKLMCFPCLRKKNNPGTTVSSSADMDETFEYIIDKYTIRKVPLGAGLPQNEMLPRNNSEGPVGSKIVIQESDIENLTKINMISDVYSMNRVTPCLPVTTHSSRTVKDKPRPTDILDPTSHIPRRPTRKPNYVAIPSKASLHTKDIMLTKREITNQYLNNFSSVFVDNLKDQVPKDPEVLPRLSRPYTSAVKDMYLGEHFNRQIRRKRPEPSRGKLQKLVYSLPDGNVFEAFCDSDGGEYSKANQEELPLGKNSADVMLEQEEPECSQRSSVRGLNKEQSEQSVISNCEPPPQEVKVHSMPMKQITYEDIQALDVGYEFSNTEKFGVKPKMTRIRKTHELERDSYRQQSTIDSDMIRLKNLMPNQSPTGHLHSRFQQEPVHGKNFLSREAEEKERRMRYLLAQNCFPPRNLSARPGELKDKAVLTNYKYQSSNFEKTDSDREGSQDSEFPSGKNTEVLERETKPENDSSTEVSRPFTTGRGIRQMKLTRPMSASSERSATDSGSRFRTTEIQTSNGTFELIPRISSTTRNNVSRSMSCESIRKKDSGSISVKQVLNFQERKLIADALETETTGSLYSRDSKTSTVLTTTASSDNEDIKRATLRWKIIIKHNKDEPKNKKPGP